MHIDLREIRLPPRAMANYVIEWLDTEERARAIDEHVKALCVALPANFLLRAMANLVLRFAKPPMPTKICNDDAAADRFVREVSHEVVVGAA